MLLNCIRYIPALIAVAVLLALAAVAASGQDEAARPAERPADAKKESPRKLDVRFKVTVEGGGERPRNMRVEISGQDRSCGTLNSNDTSVAVDESGDAVFKDLPVCKIAVKLNVSLFLPFRATVDLAAYKGPITLTLAPER